MLKDIIKECEAKMDKSVSYLDSELRGIRTGRATTALVDHVKVEYYGSPTDLKSLAAISVPEATKLVVKPFDPQVKGEICSALEKADLGLNPQIDGDAIYMNVPSPSAERRKQLVNQIKKMAEESRVAVRNERRDAIKQIDAMAKDSDSGVSEDDAKRAKDEIEAATKRHTKTIDDTLASKSAEIEQI
jgi:ribosome recycling factor